MQIWELCISMTGKLSHLQMQLCILCTSVWLHNSSDSWSDHCNELFTSRSLCVGAFFDNVASKSFFRIVLRFPWTLLKNVPKTFQVTNMLLQFTETFPLCSREATSPLVTRETHEPRRKERESARKISQFPSLVSTLSHWIKKRSEIQTFFFFPNGSLLQCRLNRWGLFASWFWSRIFVISCFFSALHTQARAIVHLRYSASFQRNAVSQVYLFTLL